MNRRQVLSGLAGILAAAAAPVFLRSNSPAGLLLPETRIWTSIDYGRLGGDYTCMIRYSVNESGVITIESLTDRDIYLPTYFGELA